jgi:hypothetical protein
MARELISYQIVADDRPVQQALGRVEASQQRVEAGAKQMGTALDAALVKAKAEMERVDAAFKRGEASAKEYAAAVAAVGKAQSDAAAAGGKVVETVKATDAATKEATKSTGVMSEAFGSLGRTIVAAVAVERLVAFGREVVATAGRVTDMAARTGLSVRAVQELGYAASVSGSHIDTVASAIGTMSRNLVNENGGAVGALTRLGLAQRDLVALQPEQAFLDIADAIGQMRNPMERAAAAQQIFGRDGQELLPGMIEGYRDLAAEAGKMNAVLSVEGVRALDQMGDAWDRWVLRAKGAVAIAFADVSRLIAAMTPELGAAPGVTQGPTIGPRDRVGEARANILRDIEGWQSPAGSLASILEGVTLPGAPGSPRPGGGAFQVAGVDDLLKIKIPEPVIQSYRTLGKTFKESADSVQSFLRSVTVAIGVNQGLRLDPSHPFARTGIAGAITTAGDSPFLPATHPMMMTGLAPTVRSGFSGYQPPTPAAGAGFWQGRGGQAVGAGLGVAGSAAIGAMAGGDQYASMIGAGASAASMAMLGGAGMSAAALGAATMGIGAAAVGVYMLAKHFTTVSKEVKQARVDIAEFQQELWKTANATQMQEAAGQDWAATVIVVRDAYDRMEKSKAEAEADVLALWDDRNPERARAAMQRITNVMNDLRDVLSEANTEMSTLLGQASQLATRLPQSLLDQLATLVDRGDLTGTNADLVRQLQGASAIDYERFKARADQVGLDPNALGSGFVQYQTTKTAQQYLDDIDLFRRGGVTDGTILAGMSDELSGLVQESLKFKTEVPENMKPFIQNLLDTGRLLDENGDKFTDISDLKWGEPVKTSTEKLIDSIQDLIDTLNGPLQRAFDNIPSEVRTRLVIDRDELPDPGDRQRTESMQHGGVVYAAQGFVARGTDTVPAMLTPGEGVLSRRGMAMLGALNGGATGGVNEDRLAEKMAVAVTRAMKAAGVGMMAVDGRTLTETLVPHIGPSLREAGAWP